MICLLLLITMLIEKKINGLIVEYAQGAEEIFPIKTNQYQKKFYWRLS